mgnify:CR=1 FL=1
MKVLNILILFFTITIFTSMPSVLKAEDCSTVKKLHKKLACISRGEAVGTNESQSEESNKSPSIFRKLKNFGGKKVGEPG